MGALGRCQLVLCGETFPGVLARRLQHAECGLHVHIVRPTFLLLVGPNWQWQEQALLREREQPRQRPTTCCSLPRCWRLMRDFVAHRAGYCGDGVEAHLSHEDPQATEKS